MPEPALLVVDSANVVGSRPDGWWRDRAGAATRLRDQLAGVAAGGVPAEGGAGLDPPVEVVLVVEGAARRVRSSPTVRVVAAVASGDDAIVDLVRARPAGRPCVVVTADRELRERVSGLGCDVRGPAWLLRAGSGTVRGRPPGRGRDHGPAGWGPDSPAPGRSSA